MVGHVPAGGRSFFNFAHARPAPAVRAESEGTHVVLEVATDDLIVSIALGFAASAELRAALERAEGTVAIGGRPRRGAVDAEEQEACGSTD